MLTSYNLPANLSRPIVANCVMKYQRYLSLCGNYHFKNLFTRDAWTLVVCFVTQNEIVC